MTTTISVFSNIDQPIIQSTDDRHAEPPNNPGRYRGPQHDGSGSHAAHAGDGMALMESSRGPLTREHAPARLQACLPVGAEECDDFHGHALDILRDKDTCAYQIDEMRRRWLASGASI